MIVQCKQCGADFKTWPSKIRQGRGKFCSPSCFHAWYSENLNGENSAAWRGGEVERTCEICGQQFTAKRAEVEKGWARFCSRECQGKWQSQERVGENSGNWGGGPVDCVCEICGKSFAVKPAYIEQGSGRFCSNTCRGAWLTLTGAVRGENNPHWKGGYVPKPYPPEFTDAFKDAIRDRDSESCAICRMEGRDVHHIDYDKDNTTEKNCITLCRSCHGVTQSNRDYWQAALSKLLQARTIGAAYG